MSLTPPTSRMSIDRELSAQRELAMRSGSRSIRLAAPVSGGETRVIDDALSLLPAVRVTVVRALPWHSGVDWWVADRLTERLPGPAPGGTGGDGPVAGPRDADEVARALAAGLSRTEPGSIVVIEEAHHADTDSIRALGTALQLASGARVLVVLTMAAAAEGAPVDAIEAITAQKLSIRPLATGEIRDILGRRSGRESTAAFARAIRELTGGDPSTTFEVIDLALGQDRTGDPGRLVPESVSRSVDTALDTVPGPSRDVAAHLAVLGVSAPWDQLGRFSDHPDPDRFSAALDPLCEIGILSVDEIPGATRVSFVRPIDRHAVRVGIRPARARDLHGKAAALLRDSDPDAALDHRSRLCTGPDDEVADEYEDRWRFHAEAGRWSAAAHAALSAAALTSDPERATTRRRRGAGALIESGRIIDALDMSRGLERTTIDPDRDAVLGHLAVHRGRRQEAAALLDRARSTADDPESIDLASKYVLHSLASWSPEDLIGWSEIATAATASAKPSAAGAQAVGLLGRAIVSSRPVDPAEVFHEEAAVAQRFALAAGWGALAADDPATALRHFEGAVPVADLAGSERISIWAQAWLARTHLLLGTWDDALRITDTAARRVEDLGLDLLSPLVHWTGAMIRSMRDEPVSAARHMAHLNPPADSYPIQKLPAAMAAMQVAASRGDYAAVRRAGAPLVALAEDVDFDQPGYWPWYELYCHGLVLDGRVPEAEVILNRQWGRALSHEHTSSLAAVESVRARIAGVRGDHTRMFELIESSLGRVDTLAIPFVTARQHFAHGQTLRRAGRRREADHSLRQARELYVQMGATVYVQRCDRERRAGGVNVERGPRQDLTPQEQAVAALVAAGNSNAQTAEELFLSVKTVQYHLTRIYAKLGVRGRAELAAVFAGGGDS